MHSYLNEIVKSKRVINATAAGITDVNGTTDDLSGFDGVRYIGLFGTLTATQVTSMKAQQGDAADGSDMADITGAVTANLADGDSNKCLILDVSRKSITKRYVRVVVDRGTANAVIDGVFADFYGSKTRKTTHDATISASKEA